MPPFEPPFSEDQHTTLDSNILDWFIPDFWGSSSLPVLETLDSIQSQSLHGTGLLPLDESIAGHETGAGKAAMQQSYRLIEDLSKRLNAELHNSGITSSFLDACLQEFFDRISPCFPVIHRPTFVPRETIPPLLLNMVALGSLFVCLPDSAHKGEMLWRLGHSTVATSWQTLITHRGPRDACDGVQLVLTALLGQLFALLSSNESIRTTAFVWHGLGFYWARTCGMYAVAELQTPPTMPCPPQELQAHWHRWTTVETQKRAILGHYILDGLISQTSGAPASARHLINSLRTAGSDVVFQAQTANDWLDQLQQPESFLHDMPFGEVYFSIFASTYPSHPLNLSDFSIFVILEGFQSLVSDLHEIGKGKPAIGTITERQILQALLNIYEVHLRHRLGSLSSPSNLSSSCLPPHKPGDSFQLLIRWHTVCLELALPTASFYRSLCQSHSHLPRTIGDHQSKAAASTSTNFTVRGTAKPMTDPPPSDHQNHHQQQPPPLVPVTRTSPPLRALLNALTITRLLNRLPFHQAHSPHIPAAIFATAVTIAGWYLSRKKEKIFVIADAQDFLDGWNWAEVLGVRPSGPEEGDADGRGGGCTERAAAAEEEMEHRFLCDADGSGVAVHLLQELNSLVICLETVVARWQISGVMAEMVRGLMGLCSDFRGL
ncbi:hypothetical protein ASPACDRAFT_127445 [Aspergillus aculeatus ATCC 16872]|uniref:Xylanolytic transcriptional activator regulatory domain-containing protein n=1 Tax=Aspergillus aculeatus (strain ATCC 16872 / CBS 172.66 / WB 5094) TaxID=690307 RepID=A0A1L9WGP6_ASPA1|nr:uncharacterized protein ASPACDRAFT_127445 [Aspergillus aculeatus ATCC 16872]OJJ95340.1 hypothetical protein ASPACDRAFT_127445 [Aspergillus aculeatus ATCC 16872]